MIRNGALGFHAVTIDAAPGAETLKRPSAKAFAQTIEPGSVKRQTAPWRARPTSGNLRFSLIIQWFSMNESFDLTALAKPCETLFTVSA